MTGSILSQKRITRAEVRARCSTAVFVFDDNMARRGMGGQAYQMRGEPNAIGIPTKWTPTMDENSFFTDADWQDVRVLQILGLAFTRIEMALRDGLDVVVPEDGIGTGLAELPQRAPVIYKYIQDRLAQLREMYPPKAADGEREIADR